MLVVLTQSIIEVNAVSEFARQLTLYKMFHTMTHEMLSGISDDDFVAIPFGGGNSPNWILGHITIGNMFTLNILGQTQEEVATWMPDYGPGSTPSDDVTKIMDRDVLQATFDRTHNEVIAAVEPVTVEFLDKTHEAPFLRKALPTNGDLLGHLLTTHFAMHVGQLSAFRRNRGMEPVLDLANS